jgi:hypothetical protein
MIKQLNYNQVGHTCGQTGRVAMFVATVLALQKNPGQGDLHCHTYDGEAADMGLDPWRLIDGFNPMVNEAKCELWFDNGGSKIVGLDQIVYVQQPKPIKELQKKARSLALRVGETDWAKHVVDEIITTGTTPECVMYLALGVASHLPDDYELQLRHELVRRTGR